METYVGGENDEAGNNRSNVPLSMPSDGNGITENQ